MNRQDEVPGSGGLRHGLADYVLPFHIEGAAVRGRLIRMGPAVNTILSRHAYPDPVSVLLGEAVTLAAMLGTALKTGGAFILQTRSDGPVSFVVAHFHAPGDIRGYAGFDEALVDAPEGDGRRLLGTGHLAMTIEPGGARERYQGVVALEGGTLAEATHGYFHRSEQIPTFIAIAVARHYVGGDAGGEGQWSWRTGGLMVQKLPEAGAADAGPEQRGDNGAIAADDDWTRIQLLAATVEDHELLDPTLEPDRLLYRLFHQEGVRAFNAIPLRAQCRCSSARIAQILGRFSMNELADMVADGKIHVTCEFCNRDYHFDAGDFLPETDS